LAEAVAMRFEHEDVGQEGDHRTQPGMPPPRRLTCHSPPRPEVDRAVATALQLAHQVLDGADLALELGRADANEAHQVRVAAGVELAVLGEHDAVERALRALALEELEVCLDRSPAVVGELRVEVQVEDHAPVVSLVAHAESPGQAAPARLDLLLYARKTEA